ncbi:MAG: flagellar biosynthetic protein FliR [Verrucomicrobiales bacterium]|nr:flagellar biosynthetic protein FliR [Verrucomicrobiales bacterium]
MTGAANELFTGLMVFFRCSAMLFLFPVLSSPQFPVRLRIALSAMVSLIVTPGALQPAPPDVQLFGLALLMLKEIGTGLLLGFVSRMTFHAMELCASIIGIEIGLNIVSTFSPMSDGRAEIFGTITYFLGAMLIFTLDLHHWMLGAFQRSFDVLPIHGAQLSMPLYYDVLRRTSGVFESGLIMAAPVLATSFLITLTFSVISRAVPTVNVFAESFSFKLLAGLLVFGFTLNLTAQHAANYLRRLPEDLLRVAKLLAPS